MIEFIYKGESSLKDYDIIAKTVSRPILPEFRKSELTIPGRHGTYDFGNNTYDNRPISVLLIYIGKDIADMRLQLRNIAAWLSSTQYLPLIFDDEPDKYYMAKIYDAAGLKEFFRAGEATVTFECLPFALYKVSTGDDLTWGDDLFWGMDISWDNAAVNTCNVTENTTFDIDYIGTQNIALGSPNGSKFNIIVTGSFTSLSISLNGKTLNYTEPISDKTIIIDNINATSKIDNSNVLYNLYGDIDTFLSLIPGINTATITGTELNCTVLFDFRPQYL